MVDFDWEVVAVHIFAGNVPNVILHRRRMRILISYIDVKIIVEDHVIVRVVNLAQRRRRGNRSRRDNFLLPPLVLRASLSPMQVHLRRIPVTQPVQRHQPPIEEVGVLCLHLHVDVFGQDGDAFGEDYKLMPIMLDIVRILLYHFLLFFEHEILVGFVSGTERPNPPYIPSKILPDLLYRRLEFLGKIIDFNLEFFDDSLFVELIFLFECSQLGFDYCHGLFDIVF